MQSLTSDLPEHFFPLLETSKNVLLVSPFVGKDIARGIAPKVDGKKVRLLTRFNLNDFQSGVSSITALQKLHDAGVEVRGLKGLHAKTYIFDKQHLISTSANLTGGGFYKNFEHGLLFSDSTVVEDSLLHFEKLWKFGETYSTGQAADWLQTIRRAPPQKSAAELPDFGGTFQSQAGKKNTFVKWLGTADERANLNRDIFGLVKETGSNFAICFSSHPNRYKDHDTVFIAIMTDTYDYAVFGKAQVYAHDRIRDVASEKEIGLVGWKKKWPYYVRLRSVEFLQGTFSGCPLLYRDVVDKLDYQAIQSTLKRHRDGEQDIQVRNVFRQKMDVRLSDMGAAMLHEAFDTAKRRVGLIPKALLAPLYNGNQALGLK